MFRSGRPVINEQIAKLSNVKTLGFLWQEYVSGIKGYKPASKFTSNERGKVKITYCRRNVSESMCVFVFSFFLYKTGIVERWMIMVVSYCFIKSFLLVFHICSMI